MDHQAAPRPLCALVLQGKYQRHQHQLPHHLLDTELFRVFADEFTLVWNRLRAGQLNEREGLVSELASLEPKIARLVEAIIITPSEEGMDIDLRGELYGILALSRDLGTRKPPAVGSEEALQIEMVAGVGFEPTTFRL